MALCVCVRVSYKSESSDLAVGPQVVHREATGGGEKQGGGNRHLGEMPANADERSSMRSQ